MPDANHNVIFDLRPAIDGLRSLRSDLEAYYWDYPAQGSQRYQISHWMRQLSDRAAALEGILLHKGAPRLQLRALPATEHEALEAADTVLDHQWVSENEPFDGVLQMVATALAAADRIGLHAAGGAPETGAVIALRL